MSLSAFHVKQTLNPSLAVTFLLGSIYNVRLSSPLLYPPPAFAGSGGNSVSHTAPCMAVSKPSKKIISLTSGLICSFFMISLIFRKVAPGKLSICKFTSEKAGHLPAFASPIIRIGFSTHRFQSCVFLFVLTWIVGFRRAASPVYSGSALAP